MKTVDPHCFRHLIGIFLFPLIFSVATAQSGGAYGEVSIISWENETHSGRFAGFSDNGRSIRLKLEEQTKSFPISKLLRISFSRSSGKKTFSTRVQLRDRSVLFGEIIEGGKKKFILRTPDLKQPVTMDLLNMVDQIEYPQTERTNGSTSFSDSSKKKDVLYEKNGDVYKGFTTKVTPKVIGFNDENLGDRTFKKEEVVRVDLAALGEPIDSFDNVYLKVFTTSGSQLKGVPTSATKNEFILQSVFDRVTWKIPYSSIKNILIKNGKTTYLSDLTPKSIVQKQKFLWLGDQKKAPPLPPRYQWRRDQSVPDLPEQSEPMSIHGKRFQKGIGCTPYTKLTYRLDKKYSRFQSTIGIDDRAKPTSTEGSVVFRVYLDGKKAYSSGERSYSEFPKEIDLDVSGVQTMTLEVDTGTGYLDFANWGAARLIRNNG